VTREDLSAKLFGTNTECDSGPEWGIVLGSGFDVWLEHLSPGERVPFGDIDGLPPATVPGHGGYFTAGSVGGKPVAIAVGRLHLYEGLTAAQIVEPVRVIGSTGAPRVLLTAAVGSVNQSFASGDGVVVTDQINFTGEDPHTGTTRYPDVSDLYDTACVKYLSARGLKQGVLAGVRGPSYETPAEVRALKTLGADVVCMSTVLEALALAGTGRKCVGVGVVANQAGSPGITHNDVLRVVQRSAKSLWPVVYSLIASGPD
jgi:purine-nucleoside phosphorylase